MNLNPVASGNKTQSGVGGFITATISAMVYAVLKQYGYDDATGALTGAVVGLITSGGLFVVGLIHKASKSEQAALQKQLTIDAMLVVKEES